MENHRSSGRLVGVALWASSLSECGGATDWLVEGTVGLSHRHTPSPWGTQERIGHATGTDAEKCQMKIKAQVAAAMPDLGFPMSEREWSLGDSNS